MKEQVVDVLGFKVPTLFYESVDEGDKAAGRVGAVLDECNKNLQYRGSNADARDLIVIVAEELSGMSPNTKKEKRGDKEVDVVDEKESVFVARAVASGKTTTEAIQAEVESRARNGWKDVEGKEIGPISVDIKARVRQAPTPPKLSAELKQGATQLLAAKDDATITKSLQKFIPDATFARTGIQDADVETLGKLMRTFYKAKQAAGSL